GWAPRWSGCSDVPDRRRRGRWAGGWNDRCDRPANSCAERSRLRHRARVARAARRRGPARDRRRRGRHGGHGGSLVGARTRGGRPRVLSASDGRPDGGVACARLGPPHDDPAPLAAVHYLRPVACLDGPRDALAGGRAPAAVAVSSNSASISPLADGGLTAACRDGDEAEARRLAAAADGTSVYAGGKLALARWVRRTATQDGWAGRGIRLNPVAPGPTLTPLLQSALDHPTPGAAIPPFPIPP